MKTARISFLLELGDFAQPHGFIQVTDKDSTFGINLESPAGCQVIGTPKVEMDDHHRCSICAAELLAAMRGMRQYGGRFADRLADLLEVADGGNTEKLLDTFHDVIWSYVPMGSEVRA